MREWGFVGSRARMRVPGVVMNIYGLSGGHFTKSLTILVGSKVLAGQGLVGRSVRSVGAGVAMQRSPGGAAIAAEALAGLATHMQQGKTRAFPSFVRAEEFSQLPCATRAPPERRCGLEQ